jgi:DDE superfamily endonuclease
VAKERNQYLRNRWKARLCQWTADQLMFLDESACNERTGDRKYGWAPVGSAARVTSPLKHTEKWSILPLYTVNGFIAWDIIKGSYNVDTFHEFVRTWVIPHTTPFPGPRSVLILDNAKIHKNPVFPSP